MDKGKKTSFDAKHEFDALKVLGLVLFVIFCSAYIVNKNIRVHTAKSKSYLYAQPYTGDDVSGQKIEELNGW